jgi:hypothetical protein
VIAIASGPLPQLRWRLRGLGVLRFHVLHNADRGSQF